MEVLLLVAAIGAAAFLGWFLRGRSRERVGRHVVPGVAVRASFSGATGPVTDDEVAADQDVGDAPEPTHRIRHLDAQFDVIETFARRVPWSSHRKTFVGWCSADRSDVRSIDFEYIVDAVDLATGEVLDRVRFWHAVLDHRDDPPPWYVTAADFHHIVRPLISFAREMNGRFSKSDRLACDVLLGELGFRLPTEPEWEGMVKDLPPRGVQEPDHRHMRPLTEEQRARCAQAARTIGMSKKGAIPNAVELLVARRFGAA